MSKKKKVKKIKKHDSPSKFQQYKRDLDNLLDTARQLYMGILFETDYVKDPKGKKKLAKSKRLDFKTSYERWYSEALEIIRQLLPNRLDDFRNLYKLEKRKEIDHLTYTISDYLIGLVTKRGGEVLTEGKAAVPKFGQQVLILQAAYGRFESSLFDIKHLLQADIFDSEIESSRELCKKGFLRGAGAVAGVVLEKHLCQVCESHNIKIPKKNPTISNHNDLLKEQGIIDTPKWRSIQRLGDLRNLCDHKKEREPTKEDVLELIDGVEKTSKTLF
jgi:hypothetical protein